MNWRLRFPLFLFGVGLLSGVYQYFPSITLSENYWLSSLQFLASIAIVTLILEKTKINEKKFILCFTWFSFLLDISLTV